MFFLQNEDCLRVANMMSHDTCYLKYLLRELLMKTITVGADIPVTSISLRPGVARGAVQPSHTGSAVAAAASGI